MITITYGRGHDRQASVFVPSVGEVHGRAFPTDDEAIADLCAEICRMSHSIGAAQASMGAMPIQHAHSAASMGMV